MLKNFFSPLSGPCDPRKVLQAWWHLGRERLPRGGMRCTIAPLLILILRKPEVFPINQEKIYQVFSLQKDNFGTLRAAGPKQHYENESQLNCSSTKLCQLCGISQIFDLSAHTVCMYILHARNPIVDSDGFLAYFPSSSNYICSGMYLSLRCYHVPISLFLVSTLLHTSAIIACSRLSFSKAFSPGSEIWSYLDRLATKFDLHRHIR